MAPTKMRVADNYSREQIEERNRFREFNKQQAVENPRWLCECGVMNFARTHNYGNGHIVTPRAFLCHNSKCGRRMFYWRETGNVLQSLKLGPTDEVDELAFTSVHDPIKFYENLKLKT